MCCSRPSEVETIFIFLDHNKFVYFEDILILICFVVLLAFYNLSFLLLLEQKAKSSHGFSN